jgi:hypothetical protein
MTRVRTTTNSVPDLAVLPRQSNQAHVRALIPARQLLQTGISLTTPVSKCNGDATPTTSRLSMGCRQLSEAQGAPEPRAGSAAPSHKEVRPNKSIGAVERQRAVNVPVPPESRSASFRLSPHLERHLATCTLQVLACRQGKHATNRPKELPVLRQLQGLHLHSQNIVGTASYPVLAPPCEMPHLHAPSFQAPLCASGHASRRVQGACETS